MALLEALLSNALAATVLALVVGGVALVRPRPAVMHALWLIVLLKLVTPPIFRLEWATPGGRSELPDLVSETVSDPGLRSRPLGVGVDETADQFVHGLSAAADRGLAEGLCFGSGSAPDEFSRVEFGVVYGVERGELELAAREPSRPADAGRSPRVLLGALLQNVERLIAPLPAPWPTILACVWFAGSAAWFLGAAVRFVRFRGHLARTRPASEELQRVAGEIAKRIGLRAAPIVRVTEASLPPLLTTIARRGLVLLPGELLRNLSPAQQAAIIGHELAHLRRRDHWVRWVEFVAIGLYWWHPVAWLARRQLRQAEELCCDAWVYRVFPDQARGYAQALMATVDFLSEVRTPVPAGTCGFGHVYSLKRRLDMILKRTWRPDLSWAARLSLIAVAAGVLPWTPWAFSQDAPAKVATPAPPHEATVTAPVPAPRVAIVTQDEGTVRDYQRTAATPEGVPAIQPPSPNQAPGGGGGRLAFSPDGSSLAVTAQAEKPSTEERLDRLEKMLGQLLDSMKPQSAGSMGVGVRTYPAPAGTGGGSVRGSGFGSTGQAGAAQGSSRASRTATAPMGGGGIAVGAEGIWSPENISPSAAKMKAQLVEMQYEIKLLELQLDRARAQYQLLQKQLHDAADESGVNDVLRKVRSAEEKTNPPPVALPGAGKP